MPNLGSNVVFGDRDKPHLGFRFNADPGFKVSILDFRIAGWLNNHNFTWQVLDGGFNSLWSSGNVVAPPKGGGAQDHLHH
jgi:hypothetical protein